MCGTDYNKNIPKIGPQTAFKLIRSHSCLESIQTNTKLNTDILNYKKTRTLFSEADYLEFIHYTRPFDGKNVIQWANNNDIDYNQIITSLSGNSNYSINQVCTIRI